MNDKLKKLAKVQITDQLENAKIGPKAALGGRGSLLHFLTHSLQACLLRGAVGHPATGRQAVCSPAPPPPP